MENKSHHQENQKLTVSLRNTIWKEFELFLVEFENEVKKEQQINNIQIHKNLDVDKQEIQEINQTIEELQKEIQWFQDSVNDIKKELKHKDEEISKLKTTLQLQSDLLGTQRSRNADRKNVTHRIVRLEQLQNEMSDMEKNKRDERQQAELMNMSANYEVEIKQLNINIAETILKNDQLKTQILQLQSDQKETTESLEYYKSQLQQIHYEKSDSELNYKQEIKSKDDEIKALLDQIESNWQHTNTEDLHLRSKNSELLTEIVDLTKFYEKALKSKNSELLHLTTNLKTIDEELRLMRNDYYSLSVVKADNKYSQGVIAELRSKVEDLETQISLRDKEIAKTKALAEKRENQAAMLNSSNPFCQDIRDNTGPSPDNFWYKEMTRELKLLEKKLIEKDEIIDMLSSFKRSDRRVI